MSKFLDLTGLQSVVTKMKALINGKVSKTGDTMTGALTTTALTVGNRVNDSTIGTNSFAQGNQNTASGQYSHAEGNGNYATGQYSHAEGTISTASGQYSHAEGWHGTASGQSAHTEGYYNTASGNYSHGEGHLNTAAGENSHAEGFSNTANSKSQHIQGEYAVADTSGTATTRGTYAHIVGNGTGPAAADRKNAHTLDWSGNAWFAGDVYVGSTGGKNKDSGSKKLATEDYVNTNGGKIDSISIDGTAQTIDANKNVNLTGLEKTANKVTSLSSSSTDTQYPSAKCVYDAIDALPEPMVFKGSLGTGGTITALPVNGTANIGDTYKVITAGTYASKSAKIGDTFICLTKTSSANTWELIPSGDEPSGTVTSVTIKATSPIAIDSSSAITSSGTRTLSHANSGVSAGTYRSVTVNATGHVTAGKNPTTLSGYGITDAKIASGVITLGSNTITPITDVSSLAPKASPALTGTPTAPTATAGTNTTQIATTAFVTAAVNTKQNKVTYSTSDLVAGSSELAEGQIYICYE